VYALLQFLFIPLVVGALPATIVLGLIIRRARHERWRIGSWIAWLLYSIALWTICLPQTRRTNEPQGEGLVIVFLIRWGPFFAAAWLVLQQWLASRENNRRGFPIRGKDE
jgi:hypothetical protein